VNANPSPAPTIPNTSEWFAPKTPNASALETESVQPSQPIPLLNFRDLNISLEQFAQFSDVEIIALSKARLEAGIATHVEELDRMFVEEPITPEEQAEADANDAKQAEQESHMLWKCQLCYRLHDETVDPLLHCTTTGIDGIDKREFSTNDGTTFEQRRRAIAAKAAAKAAAAAKSAIPLWERATELWNIPDTQLEYLAENFLVRGEVTYLTGDFGVFKTFVSMFIAEAVATGKKLFGRETQQHNVLYLDRENSKATWFKRRNLVGDLREKLPVRLLSRFTETRAPELWEQDLKDACSAVKPLVIVDSLQDFHPGLSESSPDDMTKVSLWLNDLIDAGAVGVIVMHHVPKNQNGRGGKYRGTTSIMGGAGAAFLIELTGKTSVSVSAFKTRDGENVSFEVTFKFPPKAAEEDGTGRVTYEVSGGAGAGVDAAPSARDRILRFLATCPNGATKRDIGQRSGVKTQTAHMLIKAMLLDKTLVVNADGNVAIAGIKPPREPGPDVETVGI
jgi:hypothetical protein